MLDLGEVRGRICDEMPSLAIAADLTPVNLYVPIARSARVVVPREGGLAGASQQTAADGISCTERSLLQIDNRKC